MHRIRERSDGVLLGIWGGRTHEIDGLEEPLGLRMVLDGQTWLLPNQFDPSELRTDVTGKLIRFLQDDGGEVIAGKPYAEVEAMKMVMPLIAGESGTISHEKSGGAVIEAGDLLGSLTLKDPNKVKKISPFGGEFRCAADEGPRHLRLLLKHLKRQLPLLICSWMVMSFQSMRRSAISLKGSVSPLYPMLMVAAGIARVPSSTLLSTAILQLRVSLLGRRVIP